MDRLFEVSSYASFIVYHIEAMDKIKVPKRMIQEYVNLQKTVGSFPGELEYVASFYDEKTGSSGTLFENTVEENYILAYTGTNFYFDRQKDMYADVVGICLGQGEHLTSCYRFYTRMKKKYGDNIILTGHSLGGSIAQRVAIEYDVKESVVFNAAPIYLIGGIDIFMDKKTDGELYVTRMKKYLRNVKKTAIKKATFTGCVKRVVSEYDIFTRISELLSIGYYVGDEIIVKEAGMHGIKSFLDIYNKSFGSSFKGEENQDGYLSSEYKDFGLAEVGILSNFSEERIVELEKQLNVLLTSDTVISNLNKNPYNVNFEFFIKAILKNIEKDKEK
ncbi:acetoin dehydrogenase dihydrolipoyllysine-residue acetyltransferase subunit [Streptococcus sp. UMB1385]|nr:acetoin dehydrogenase dihydrolipoyllysine-residue acetyltransferase subunit [Streptococcus sp. UMB1385]